jgi:hypothetical protein
LRDELRQVFLFLCDLFFDDGEFGLEASALAAVEV